VDQWVTRELALWWPIRGSSMVPALVDGDEVLVEPLRAPPRPGDVVVFRRREGGLVAHRVVSVDEGEVRTWGDACRDPDPTKLARAVLFRATRLRRAGRELPIPRLGWRARLYRARFPLTRALARLRGAPGRS
jgi:hypothetical protein